MNLHEYQAKQLFEQFGLPVSAGVVINNVDDVEPAITELGGSRWVAKVQVHAGGRGKAGGVRVVAGQDELIQFVNQWLGAHIVTKQTDNQGQPVSCIYVESLTEIERELYLGVVIDRASQKVVVMASTEGGVDIETVAAETPDTILRSPIEPGVGAQEYQGRSMAYQLGFTQQQVRQFTDIYLKLCRLFHDNDCSLVEINPLVTTTEGNIHCLDAKISIDSNALFRQPDLTTMHDATQIDDREAHAAKYGLSYVAMDGAIGCMVNGAGLAMGTMDLVKLYGGSPANFLDVGGGVNIGAVSEAFKIILSDEAVKTVLINIFGGIVSCEVIANGIVAAVEQVGVNVPVVVRFDGNSAAEGRAVLQSCGLNIHSASTLQEAARLAVQCAA